MCMYIASREKLLMVRKDYAITEACRYYNLESIGIAFLRS